MQPGWILFQKFFKILFTVPIPVIVSAYNKGRSPETGKASYIITNEAIDMKIESVEKTGEGDCGAAEGEISGCPL